MNRTFLLFLIFLFIMSPSSFGDSKIKEPNVSGQFYEANAKRLLSDIKRFMDEADVEPSERDIKIIISPHAGYMYSGGVAAYGFKAASARKYKTIIILAPSHHVGFDGISIWNEGAFQTPLGQVQVDNQVTEKLLEANDKFQFLSQVFSKEHSLEVEIPFLQATFEDFKIVPVIMGQPDLDLVDDFANILKDVVGTRKDVLIVVSSDLSHYHDGDSARRMDLQTIDAVKNLKVKQLWQENQSRSMEMCGIVPVMAALLYAQKMGFNDGDILKYAHSGDVTGDTDRVVGYASIVFYDNSDEDVKNNVEQEKVLELLPRQKKRLLEIARETIEQYVRNGKRLEIQEADERLLAEEGAFVTIHKSGMLRGCIGHIMGDGPLYKTVRDVAILAASEDPRFSPLTTSELEQIDVEVSVLSKPWEIKDIDEIHLGIHGVIISQGLFHKGVYLPQVAIETRWTKEEFLSSLCAHKAGLPANAWKDPRTKIQIFTADVFSEKELDAQ